TDRRSAGISFAVGMAACWVVSASAQAPVANPQAPSRPVVSQPAAPPSVSAQPIPPSSTHTEPPAAAPVPVAPSTSAPAAPPAPAVGNASVSPLELPRDLSPWGMFMNADIIVKLVMIGLVFASLVTWTVCVAKYWELSVAVRKARASLGVLNEARSLGEA